MSVGLQTNTGHADGIFDAALGIDDIFAGQNVKDLAAIGEGNGPGGFDDAVDVFLADLAFRLGDGDDTLAVLGLDMFSGNGNVGIVDRKTSHSFGGFDTIGDGGNGFIDVNNLALSDTPARGSGDTNNIDLVGVVTADGNKTTNFAAANVNGIHGGCFGHYYLSIGLVYLKSRTLS